MIPLLFFLVLWAAALVIATSRPKLFLPFILCTGPLKVSADLGVGIDLSAVWLLIVILLGMGLVIVRGGVGKLAALEVAALLFVFWCGVQ